MEVDILASESLHGDSISKYKMAAHICNIATSHLVSLCVPAASVTDLCSFGDLFLAEQLEGVFNKGQVEKGIAFPVCLSGLIFGKFINEGAANFSPLPEDATLLQIGDVIKITLGVQIDGYIALSGHTHVMGPGPVPVEGKAADAVCAAHYAAEAVRRSLRPGVKSWQLTNLIEKVAAEFNCTPVLSISSFNMKRFIFEGEHSFLNRFADEVKPGEFEVAEDDVYNIDIMMSTGAGRLQHAEPRCTVFRRNLLNKFQLKSKSGRAAYAEITARYPTMPFCARTLDSPNTRLAIKECVDRGLLIAYPPLTEKRGEIVAQEKFTALVRPAGTERITSHPAPYVHSIYNIRDPELLELLA